MIASISPTSEEINAEFVTLLPELTSRLNHRFRFRAPEAREESVAESIAMSWLTFVSARTRGKDISAGNLAFYSGHAVEAGRKVCGVSGTDALSDTPLARKHMLPHINYGHTGDSLAAFCTTFGDKRWRWPILDYVAPHLDFQAFRARCRPRDREILDLKASGTPQNEIATELGISPPAVNQRLRLMESRWQAMSGV